MMECNWADEFTGAVTICNLNGNVVYMNNRAAELFQNYGGISLVGKSLLDCHPESARTRLLQLLESGESNVYTIEKNGVKKILHQTPWFKDGRRCGMIELSLEIPFDIPHYIRS
jgi:transcriptional regulator with PAS, ATPase and Fis domain